MKNDEIQPIPGQPTQFKIYDHLYDLEPFFELLRIHSAKDTASDMDEIMMLLIELNACEDSFNGDYIYKLYCALRRLRDFFNSVEISAISQSS